MCYAHALYTDNIKLFTIPGLNYLQIQAIWNPGPDYKGCVVAAPWMHLISMSISTIAVYAFLLTAMLAGLLRQRQARSFGIWKMLCKQVRYSPIEDFGANQHGSSPRDGCGLHWRSQQRYPLWYVWSHRSCFLPLIHVKTLVLLNINRK